MPIQTIDIVFDLFVGMFYLYSLLYGVFLLTNLKRKGYGISILMVFLCLVAVLYLFQTGYQYLFNTDPHERLWDIYNLVQSMANLIAVQTIARMTGKDPRCENTIIKNLPLA